MPEPEALSRARVACKVCNARRVKCDRTPSGGACSNCRRARTPCELIESRRGKYKRSAYKPRRQQEESASQGTEESPPAESAESSPTVRESNTQSSRQIQQTQRYVSPSLPDFMIHNEAGGAAAKVVYMGDSGNMKYLIDQVGDPFKTSAAQNRPWGENLQRHMTEKLGHATQRALKNLRLEDEQHLRNLGAFRFPEQHISDELIDTFFACSYPVFPVFNRDDFISSYKTGSLSPLVLNAVYYMAAIHCSETLLEALGFNSRYLACLTFYRRAKALYDAEYDSDGIATVQATILLLNWWGGPMEQKDTWHWLGAAAGLAQALGMHRAKSYPILSPLHQKLWRRVWWVLYINDIHHAAVFGRPPHIHQNYCDIEPLTEDDFTDYPFDDSASTTESKLYLIHLAELASRVSNCLVAKFSATHNPAAEQKAYRELLGFENKLGPDFLNLPSNITLGHGFWPSLIQLSFYDYQIVFYRMLSDAPDDGFTFGVAGKISRILEDLLASGTLYRAPFMVLPAIFASILVHIIHCRKDDVHVRVIAEHRARLAMHILDNFQDAWPIVIWTRYLLDILLKGPISTRGAQRSCESGDQNTGLSELPSHQSQGSNLSYRRHDRTRRPNLHLEQDDLSDANNEDTLQALTGDIPSSERDLESMDLERYATFADSSIHSIPHIFPMINLLEDVGLNTDDWLFNYNN